MLVKRRRQHRGGDCLVVLLSKSVECLVKGDEVARNEAGALVNELVERMLTVGPGLTPIDRTGVAFQAESSVTIFVAVANHRSC